MSISKRPLAIMRLELRSLVSQSAGIFPHVCLQFALGTFTGFNVILIAELHKPDSQIPTTLEQLSWFAALDFVVLVGTMITGAMMHRLGDRLVALTSALSFVSSLLLFYFATTTTMIFVGRVLNSLTAVYTLSISYISEVSEPRFRSAFLAIAKLSVSIGTFFTLLLGSFMNWRAIALVNLVFPVLAAVTVLVTPRSPVWLASKGRLDETEMALCWLRGWVPSDQVQVEFRALVDSAWSSKSTPNESTTNDSWHERSRQFLSLFLQRSVCLPLGTMSLISLLYYLSGMNATETYATVIFRELDSPIEESTATAIMGAMGVVGNLIILLIIHRTGKRKLVFLSVVVVGLCQAVVAGVGLLELRGDYLWIPPIALIVANLANAAGIGAVLYMILGEVFPSSVRYIGTAVVTSVRMVLKSLTNKSFLYAVEVVTLPGVFLVFAIVNLMALVTYYYSLPETEGKSLKEIEDHYKGVESTNVTKK